MKWKKVNMPSFVENRIWDVNRMIVCVIKKWGYFGIPDNTQGRYGFVIRDSLLKDFYYEVE